MNIYLRTKKSLYFYIVESVGGLGKIDIVTYFYANPG